MVARRTHLHAVVTIRVELHFQFGVLGTLRVGWEFGEKLQQGIARCDGVVFANAIHLRECGTVINFGAEAQKAVLHINVGMSGNSGRYLHVLEICHNVFVFIEYVEWLGIGM